VGRAHSDTFGPDDVERARLVQALRRRGIELAAIVRADRDEAFLARYVAGFGAASGIYSLEEAARNDARSLPRRAAPLRRQLGALRPAASRRPRAARRERPGRCRVHARRVQARLVAPEGEGSSPLVPAIRSALTAPIGMYYRCRTSGNAGGGTRSRAPGPVRKPHLVRS
jgi:hypothetical protein